MLRLNLEETSRSTEHARSAAIAALGQRLAAAGPRTRQRVTKRYHPTIAASDPDDARPLSAARPAPLTADRTQAFVREAAPLVLPRPRNKLLTALGRAAALGLMASAGFAAVLVAQNPRWRAPHHDPVLKPAVIAAAKTQPAPAPDLPAPPASARPEPTPQLVRDDTPPAPVPKMAPAVQPATLPPKPPPPQAPAAPAARPIQVQLAVAHAASRVAAAKATLPMRRDGQHPVVLAHYELPRWLTEGRPSAPPKPLIMSPPPHNLDAPAAATAPAPAAREIVAAAPEKPRAAPPALPPLPRPRLVYASAAYPPPLPRGAYYGYPYGYPGGYGYGYPYGMYRPQPYAP